MTVALQYHQVRIISSAYRKKLEHFPYTTWNPSWLSNGILSTCRTDFYQLTEWNLANLPVLCWGEADFRGGGESAGPVRKDRRGQDEATVIPNGAYRHRGLRLPQE